MQQEKQSGWRFQNHARQRPERIRLFRHDRIEKLTLTPPLLFMTVWSIILLLAIGGSWQHASLPRLNFLGLVLAGIVVWTLFEYAVHRFVFHLPIRSAVGRRLIFLLHGNHHLDPSDPYRNVMPIGASLTLAGLFWLLFRAASPSEGPALFLGFVIGYVLYDGTHLACHQFRMPGSLLGSVKRHHLRHHHAASGDSNFAITAIFWDRVFASHLERKPRPLPRTTAPLPEPPA